MSALHEATYSAVGPDLLEWSLSGPVAFLDRFADTRVHCAGELNPHTGGEPNWVPAYLPRTRSVNPLRKLRSS